MERNNEKIDINIDITNIEMKKKQWMLDYIILIKNAKNNEHVLEEIINKIYEDGFEDGYNEYENDNNMRKKN